ncbi:MAG: 3-phosphoshikimate 1-carboxyvinyltransferase [Proteobacteria bacterium]|nr:3-phosphoshikimate 1-carboxyvinyltransferase [Pseudomonadota bacterium]MBU1709195.1 3-phosphoshikimate 1-carboxyvinyltransferase [Pseudomonadota bacterium]
MKEITPLRNIQKQIEVPGSKSITQRALIAAALANGSSKLLGPLASEDTHYTSEALRAMGIKILDNDSGWQVNGTGGVIHKPVKDIYLGNNGTATRFLTSVAAMGSGDFIISGDKRMEERPIGPLLEALSGWGVDIKSIHGTGCPPIAIKSRGICGGKTLLPEGKSSQYLSSLLLVAPYAEKKAELEVAGEVYSKPYVLMTLAVMDAFGIHVDASDDLKHFVIDQGCYRSREYQIEGDASSASYFWAAAAITGGRVTVGNVPKPSLQGDAVLVDIFERMGCRVEYGQGITVVGPKELQGIEVDMGDCPDVVPTLAVVASQARGRTIIKNIAHLRIKECDRLHVMVKELAKLGARIQELDDAMIIEGLGSDAPPMHGGEIETYNDHRIAMSFAVAGLVVPGVKVLGGECVVKSFPDFWERFQLLY